MALNPLQLVGWLHLDAAHLTIKPEERRGSLWGGQELWAFRDPPSNPASS